MLPPIDLLKLDAASFDAKPGTRPAIQGEDGFFGSTFEGLLRPQTAPLLNPAIGPGTGAAASEAGQTLPDSGNALPRMDPGIAINRSWTDVVNDPADLADLPDLAALAELTEDADVLPQTLSAELIPLPGAVPAEFSGMASLQARDSNAPAPAPTDVSLSELADLRTPPQATLPTDAAAVAFKLLDQPQAKTEAPALDISRLVDAQDPKQLPQPASNAALPAPAAATTAPLPGSASAPALSDINLAPGGPGWGDALGDRLMWMTGNKLQSAEIRLSPAELGPLRVQISMDDGAATVNFTAQHPLTREAIEQALPRLREMLGDQGLTLSNVTVSEHNVKHEQSRSGRQGMAQALTADDSRADASIDDLPRQRVAHSTAGLVDLFA
ncbi:MAG: flagellar hook-length control protein FliK [Woeseia sp.]